MHTPTAVEIANLCDEIHHLAGEIRARQAKMATLLRDQASDFASLLREQEALAAIAEPESPGIEGWDRLTLTERRIAVLLIRSSLGHSELAQELHVSTNTVKTHARRIYHKLGIHSRAELRALGAVLQLSAQGVPVR